MRGGEKVLEVLCELFPEADLYTMVHVPGSVTPVIENRRIFTSCLDRLPGVGGYYRNLLPLMPWAAGRMRLEGYDLVVAVSHCVAHRVRVAEGTRLFVLPGADALRLGPPKPTVRAGGAPASSLLLRRLQPRLQEWNRQAARRVTQYVSHCENVRERVRRCLDRESAVVFLRWTPITSARWRPRPAASTCGRARWRRTSAWPWRWRRSARWAASWW